MIRVEIIQDEDVIKSIRLIGHSGMADAGEDVVCAGVSLAFIGSLNALEEIDNFDIKYDKGMGSVIAKNTPNQHDKIVLEVMMTQLQCIAEDYSRYLSINLKKEGAK